VISARRVSTATLPYPEAVISSGGLPPPPTQGGSIPGYREAGSTARSEIRRKQMCRRRSKTSGIDNFDPEGELAKINRMSTMSLILFVVVVIVSLARIVPRLMEIYQESNP
jgi:hypothetical protein